MDSAPPRDVRTAKDLTGVNLNYLIPDTAVPCAIFLFFKDSFIQAMKAGETLTLPNFCRIKADFYCSGFILRSEQAAWDAWKLSRHPQLAPIQFAAPPQAPKLHAKGLELVAYAQSKYFYPEEDATRERTQKLVELFRAVTAQKSIGWFFETSIEPEVRNHCARVSYLVLLFTGLVFQSFPEALLEQCVSAALIHELDGDPAKPAAVSVSARTLETIQTSQRRVPKPLLDQIAQHDELFNGKGAPRALSGNALGLPARIFALCNAFDHLRLGNPGGTRRVRFERVKTLMSARKAEFDPALFTLFWNFMSKLEVAD